MLSKIDKGVKCKVWKKYISEERNERYFKSIEGFLSNEYNSGKIIYPSIDTIFKAFEYTQYEDVLCCIIGQDPYHTENKAMGLSFSIPEDEKITPSLRNINIELTNEYGEQNRQIQDLSNWAKNGVLLLNTVLTVEKGKPNSHKKIGWNIFTDGVIKLLNDSDKPIVFILWGNDAQTKEPLISNNKHLIIKSPHPSPFSARKGFFGSKCFSKANDFLQENRNQKISWI
mgnify:CR=1 FL=1